MTNFEIFKCLNIDEKVKDLSVDEIAKDWAINFCCMEGYANSCPIRNYCDFDDLTCDETIKKWLESEVENESK